MSDYFVPIIIIGILAALLFFDLKNTVEVQGKVPNLYVEYNKQMYKLIPLNKEVTCLKK